MSIRHRLKSDCDEFEPKQFEHSCGDCQTDGHYLCIGCKHIASYEDMELSDNRMRYYPNEEKERIRLEKEELESQKDVKVKLTKSALNKFIIWSSSRYNDYLGYGNKKFNVELVYKALIEGNYKGETIFKIKCAAGCGENVHGRNWRVKGGSDNYTINCETMTIEAEYSKRTISFLAK